MANFLGPFFGGVKKRCMFAAAIEGREAPERASKDIVLWCNGNTSDSGPEILGSSPSRTTEQNHGRPSDTFGRPPVVLLRMPAGRRKPCLRGDESERYSKLNVSTISREVARERAWL